MHELQLSCYICQHVRRALVSARLIVNLGSGHWAAACSTQCLDQSDSDDLFTIRLAYLSHLRGLPLPLQSLPVGSALRRNEIGWSLSYFDMEFRPSEDETHAVPPDHPVRGYDAREIVQAFRSGPHRFATATLQDRKSVV